MTALRIAATVAIVAFLVRALASNWAAYRSAHYAVTPHWGWLAASLGMIVVTYALQIESWRHVIGGWGQRIRFAHAAEAWTLANLGRYVPGKVWSVAGLVVLAARRGVAMWASTASAFVVQGLGLATAFAIVVVTLPGYLKPVYILLGAAASIACMLVLGSAKLMAAAARLAGDKFPVKHLPLAAMLSSGALTFASWATYGVAFWSLGRGLGYGAGTAFTPWAAMGMFALAYTVGLLALFIPGGFGVREGYLTALLAPIVGTGGAVIVSVASRLLLTITEALSAGIAVLMARGAQPLEIRADEPHGEP